ncbi:AAA family ATPase [Herbidospora sp. NEAU-GS84]|uniref:AAA family ATPase n=1 Tax=Herbidospora solisilvae TaxID=2696284 RepID=A0A7C9N3X5_9ACTN|nr:AAA family ATPase [Herbidospora solisilvae]NAS25009.1 AAA family ATPase [Herbidospora solisilvae]
MDSQLIGRDHPAGLLRAEIGRALDSHGGLVLVTGEAGIGKTTLVTRGVEEARRAGALVLGGSCWQSGGAPGYWPWVQVIRALRRAGEWSSVGAEAAEVLAILLGERSGGGKEVLDGFRLYDAVTTALVSAAQRRPVVVVLDDLHWADTASLKLLEFAAQHTWFERLLLLGTYRDVEAEAPDHPLAPLIMPLVAKATCISLTGLGRDEVGALMARTAGRAPEPALVDEVHRRTGGNPFFVEQTTRLWQGGGSVTAIAPGVRDALQKRVSLLPPQVAELLTDASVLGREFHRDVLAALAGLPAARVDGLLAQAVAARLVVQLTEGRLGFAHDLVRETLYESLGERAAGRHARVITALDADPALKAHLLPADQARHAYQAGRELPPSVAVERLLSAAGEAQRRMAIDESIGHLRRAADRGEGLEPRRRAMIAMELSSCLFHLDDAEEVRATLESAWTFAQQTGDADLLARVAISYYRIEGPGMIGGFSGGRSSEVVRIAYQALIGGDPTTPDAMADELAVHIAAVARADDDHEALTFGLAARHDVLFGLGTAAERIELTSEMETVARRASDPDTEHFAASLRWVALLEAGDPAYLDQFSESTAFALRIGGERMIFAARVDQSIIMTLAGRFAEAEEFLRGAMEVIAEDSRDMFGFMSDHVLWSVLLHQGRFAEIPAVLERLRSTAHNQVDLLAGITALQAGDLAGALSVLPDNGLDAYPRSFAPLGLRFMAHAAAESGDARLTAWATETLTPHSGGWLVSIGGCDIAGPVDHWLGVLAASRGRWDDAIARFTAARASAVAFQARPWVVEAGVELGRALLAAGEPLRGRVTLDEAAAEAAELGMRHIRRKVEEIRPAQAAGPARPARVTPTFRRDGDVWELAYDDQVVRMPDAKGLRDLHLLLGAPGTDIPAVRLLNPEGGHEVVAARGFGGDAVLDGEAKARYRRHLARLDDEIDRAAGLGDDDRAAALDRERQALLDELRAAAGLAGRDRRLGDEAERARKTVTARIRDTLRKLGERHPSLASHLRESISTGSSCGYRPGSPVRWRL